MILIGCFLRLWETGIIGFYMSEYFSIYNKEYQTYSDFTAIGSFVGGLFSTFTSGLIVDFFEKRSEMTIPMLCVIKALIDLPLCVMTYYQQQNFWVSLIGV
jgi:hypothetical protein